MTLSESPQALQFIVGQNGETTAVVLAIPVWEKIVALLEDNEDLKLVQARLQNWRSKKGWTNWEAFEQELVEDGLSTVD